jgi:predicted porin
MKKLLLALFALAGISTANAQSSVTMYGVLDVGYTGITQRIGTNEVPVQKSQTNQFGQSAQSSSRLGIRGTEALGGGTSAFFTAEFQLYPQNQSLSGGGSRYGIGYYEGNNGGLQNRQTFVGISQKGYGQVALGTQFTPVFTSVAATDPGATNNVVGSVIYAANGSDGLSNNSFTARSNNAITFKTDSFRGFTVGGMFAQNNQDTTQNADYYAGGRNNQGGYGLNADYTWKKLYATVAYQNFKTQQPYDYSVPAFFAGSGNTDSVNTNDVQTYVGATYDFGILKAYASWIGRNATSTIDSSQYLKRQAQQIGVRAFVTPKIEGWASVGNGRFNAVGTGQQLANANFIGYQAGANYYLSKRTNLYTIVGSTQTTSSSSLTAGTNQYAMGVRHTF